MLTLAIFLGILSEFFTDTVRLVNWLEETGVVD